MKPLIIDREIVLGNRVILWERSRENHEDGECRCQQGQQNAAALQMGTHRILHSNATTSTTERFKCRIKLSGAGMVRNILLADSGAYKVRRLMRECAYLVERGRVRTAELASAKSAANRRAISRWLLARSEAISTSANG